MELEKIEMLFKSHNRGDNKYGQKVCHALKIDYYVISYKAIFGRPKNLIIYYTLNEPEDLAEDVMIRVNMDAAREDFVNSNVWKRVKLYKIKLNKNGRKINEGK